MSTPTPDEQDIESTLGHLSKADLLTLIKRMVQLYPDLAGLIETAQQTTPSQRPRHLPFNPEFYRRQVDEIFYTTDRNTWGSEGRAAEPLLRIVDIGNDYVQQQNYSDAAWFWQFRCWHQGSESC